MSLTLYLSDSHEKLINKLLQVLKDSPQDPFIEQKIIIQRQGISSFLKNELVKKKGIICNLDLPFLNTFVHNTLEECLEEPPDFDFFQPSRMCWEIYSILKDIQEDYEDIKQYIQGGQKTLKLFQLSEKVADVFDDYQIYRPNLLLKWKNCEEESDSWQAVVWRRLTEDRISIKKGFKNFIFQNLECSWERNYICVYGIPTMAPIYLSFFKKLSQYIDVYFFHISPFKEVSIPTLPNQDNKYQQPFLKNDIENNLNISFSNSLLEKLGSTNFEFTTLLFNISDSTKTYFSSRMLNNTLKEVQQSILSNNNTIDYTEDQSIQIHSTHSPHREVETLYNYILDIINKSSDITPGDISVIIPQIDEYIHHIEAIFERFRNTKKFLPYNIADQPPAGFDRLKNTLLKILNIDQSRFKASYIIDILENKVVRNKFEIEKDNLNLIKKWLEEAGIRWGLDSEYHSKYGEVDFEENSWQFGLKRMLLGYAFRNEDEDRFFKDILPYDEIEGEYAIILGNLVAFIEELKKTYYLIQEEHSLKKWQNIIIQVLNNFFSGNSEIQSYIIQLRHKIQSCFENLKHKKKYKLPIIKNFLKNNLIAENQGHGYFRGKVTIGSPQHMFGIPSKVTCILGLNEGEYPREDRTISFNKLGDTDWLADRSKQKEDQNMFLQSLMTTHKNLFLSYQGFDNRTNEEFPPSLIISDLIDFIMAPGQNHNQLDKKDNPFIIKHPLNSFNYKYFIEEENQLYSYFQNDYEAASALLKRKQSIDFWNSENSLPKWKPGSNFEVETNQFIKFYKNPVQYFAKNRLGINFKTNKKEIEDQEPLELDSLENYILQNYISNKIVKNKPKEEIYQTVKSKGQLPIKNRSRPFFESKYEQIKQGLKTSYVYNDNHFQPNKLLQNADYKQIKLEKDKIIIAGEIGPITNNILVYFQPSKFKGKHAVQMWIKHILLNNFYKELHTLGIMKNNKNEFQGYYLKPLQEQDSILVNLVKLFKQGMESPLPFFPNSSYQKLDNPNNRNYWDSNYRDNNEYDQYAELFFKSDLIETEEFEQLSKKIFSPFKYCLEKLEGNNKKK